MDLYFFQAKSSQGSLMIFFKPYDIFGAKSSQGYNLVIFFGAKSSQGLMIFLLFFLERKVHKAIFLGFLERKVHKAIYSLVIFFERKVHKAINKTYDFLERKVHKAIFFSSEEFTRL